MSSSRGAQRLKDPVHIFFQGSPLYSPVGKLFVVGGDPRTPWLPPVSNFKGTPEVPLGGINHAPTFPLLYKGDRGGLLSRVTPPTPLSC